MKLPRYKGQELIRPAAGQYAADVSGALAPVTNLLTQAAERERRDWETADFAYRHSMMLSARDRIQEGIRAGEYADENDVRGALDQTTGAAFDRVDPARTRRLEAARTILESGLVRDFKQYRAEEGKRRTIQAIDQLKKEAIDAASADEAKVYDGLVRETIGESGLFEPMEKEALLDAATRGIWESRMDRALEDPRADIRALEAEIRGLDLDADTREGLLKDVREKGKAIQRANLDVTLLDLKNLYIQLPQEREAIKTELVRTLREKEAVLNPGEFEERYQQFLDDAVSEAVYRDMLDYGADFAMQNMDQGAFVDERRKTRMIQYLEDEKQRELIEADRDEQREERARNEEYRVRFTTKYMKIMDAEQPDLKSLRQLQHEVMEAGMDGYPGALSFYQMVSRVEDVETERLRTMDNARRLFGTYPLTQEETDLYFSKWVEERGDQLEAQGKQRDDFNEYDLIAEYARGAKRLPTQAVKRLEDAVASEDPVLLQSAARLADRLEESPIHAYYDQVPSEVRDILQDIRPDMDENQVSQVFRNHTDIDDKKQERRRKYVTDREVMDGAVLRVQETMRKLAPDWWPGIDATGALERLFTDPELAHGILSEAEDRVEQKYATINGSTVTNIADNVAKELIGDYTPWFTGRSVIWMEDGPMKYAQDPVFLLDEMDKMLDEFGYTMKRREFMRFYPGSLLGAADEQDDRTFVEVRLERDRTSPEGEGMPNYNIEIQIDPEEGYVRLFTKDGIPAQVPGAELMQEYRFLMDDRKAEANRIENEEREREERRIRHLKEMRETQAKAAVGTGAY